MIKNLKTNKIEDNRKEIWALLQNQNEIYGDFSNPNFLYNGDFYINQRGATSYTSQTSTITYTVDRWALSKIANTKCTKSAQGVTLQHQKTTTGSLYLQPVSDAINLRGRTVTFSLKYKNLSGKMCLSISDNGGNTTYSTETTNAEGILTLTTVVSETCTTLSCEIVKRNTTASFTVLLLEAKLEVGSKATQFTPRPYEEELSLCERFYLRVPNYWGRIARYSDYRLALIIYVNMRSLPKLAFDSYYIQQYQADSLASASFNDGFTFSVGNRTPACIRILASKTNHEVHDGLFHFNNLQLDSEIYI